MQTKCRMILVQACTEWCCIEAFLCVFVVFWDVVGHASTANVVESCHLPEPGEICTASRYWPGTEPFVWYCCSIFCFSCLCSTLWHCLPYYYYDILLWFVPFLVSYFLIIGIALHVLYIYTWYLVYIIYLKDGESAWTRDVPVCLVPLVGSLTDRLLHTWDRWSVWPVSSVWSIPTRVDDLDLSGQILIDSWSVRSII